MRLKMKLLLGVCWVSNPPTAHVQICHVTSHHTESGEREFPDFTCLGITHTSECLRPDGPDQYFFSITIGENWVQEKNLKMKENSSCYFWNCDMTKMLLHSLSKLAIITNGQKKLEQCRKLNKLTFSLLLTLSLTFYVICNSAFLTAAPAKIGKEYVWALQKVHFWDIFFLLCRIWVREICSDGFARMRMSQAGDARPGPWPGRSNQKRHLFYRKFCPRSRSKSHR